MRRTSFARPRKYDSQTSSSLQPSRFLSLPHEIRLQIYQAVLGSHYVSISRPEKSSLGLGSLTRRLSHASSKHKLQTTSQSLSLLLVSRLISHEASRIFYSDLGFSFDEITHVVPWVTSMPVAKITYVRRLRVRTRHWPETGTNFLHLCLDSAMKTCKNLRRLTVTFQEDVERKQKADEMSEIQTHMDVIGMQRRLGRFAKSVLEKHGQLGHTTFEDSIKGETTTTIHICSE